MLDKRRAGVLLHPTSLPSGIIGADARRFVDWLSDCGFTVWQVLPLGPPVFGLSPYSCLSAHAGNTSLVDRQGVVETDATGLKTFEQFIEEHKSWLNDYALFVALKTKFKGAPWWEWPKDYKLRKPETLHNAHRTLSSVIQAQKYSQFVFFHAWCAIKRYANDKGVKIFGDMPIYVAQDSAEVWLYPELFKLHKEGDRQLMPSVVAGVPPDYFSETGQLWGNPIYDWNAHESDGFRWWIARIAGQLELFDSIRIDHFRGFEAYWEVPADADTAQAGQWVKAPGDVLLQTLRDTFHDLPIVAEDLGMITREVEGLRDRFGLPGMKVLQFAFDGDDSNPYLLKNHVENCVVYTGTHDNDTTRSWFYALEKDKQQHVLDVINARKETMPWALIEQAFASIANLAVIPMQDVLGLGGNARMNRPGTLEGNWQWRFHWDELSEEVTMRCHSWITEHGRLT